MPSVYDQTYPHGTSLLWVFVQSVTGSEFDVTVTTTDGTETATLSETLTDTIVSEFRYPAHHTSVTVRFVQTNTFDFSATHTVTVGNNFTIATPKMQIVDRVGTLLSGDPVVFHDIPADEPCGLLHFNFHNYYADWNTALGDFSIATGDSYYLPILYNLPTANAPPPNDHPSQFVDISHELYITGYRAFIGSFRVFNRHLNIIVTNPDSNPLARPQSAQLDVLVNTSYYIQGIKTGFHIWRWHQEWFNTQFGIT